MYVSIPFIGSLCTKLLVAWISFYTFLKHQARLDMISSYIYICVSIYIDIYMYCKDKYNLLDYYNMQLFCCSNLHQELYNSYSHLHQELYQYVSSAEQDFIRNCIITVPNFIRNCSSMFLQQNKTSVQLHFHFKKKNSK